MDEIEELRQNIALVEERIARACENAGRRREEVTLVAASKMNDAARVKAAHRAGITVFGENKVQEYTAKNAESAYEGAKIHIIGHLQKNKVKYVAGQVDLIESVDSVELLRTLEQRCAALGKEQDVLVEVNLAGEESKTGLDPAKLDELLCAAGTLSFVRVQGLMTMAPKLETSAERRAYFCQMYELFVDIRAKKYDNVKMVELSMGMSGDFEEAIAEGATMVRLGTAIFGARNYGTVGCT